MRLSLFFILVTLSLSASGIPTNNPFPGGVIVQEIEATERPEVFYGKRQLMVLENEKKGTFTVIAGLRLSQK